MRFIINSEQLIKSLSVLPTSLSPSTVTMSVIDCFKFETHSTGCSQAITDIASERVTSIEMPTIEQYEGPVPTRLVVFNETRCEHEHFGTVHLLLVRNRTR